MSVRREAPEERFYDVKYSALTQNPIEEALRVLAASGIPMTHEIERGMEDWIEANRREHRAAHKYTLEDFELTADDIRVRYHDYITQFV